MVKKIIAFSILLLTVCIISGCGVSYPSIRIYTSRFEAFRDIDIGKPYVYEGFDIENTDSGKDLILHFAEEKDDKRGSN